jgi:hypothetical protein
MAALQPQMPHENQVKYDKKAPLGKLSYFYTFPSQITGKFILL